MVLCANITLRDGLYCPVRKWESFLPAVGLPNSNYRKLLKYNFLELKREMYHDSHLEMSEEGLVPNLHLRLIPSLNDKAFY